MIEGLLRNPYVTLSLVTLSQWFRLYSSGLAITVWTMWCSELAILHHITVYRVFFGCALLWCWISPSCTGFASTVMPMATPFEPKIKTFWNWVISIPQSLTCRDVCAPGPSSFRLLDWVCYHRTPLCHILFPTRIFHRGVPGVVTDCLCGVWWRGLTTCPLYVGPHFGNNFQMTAGL